MKSSINRIQSQTIVSRNPDLIYNQIDDEIVILSIENEEYYYLNSIGSEVWNAIAEPKKFSNIIDILLESYDVSKDVCESETIQYLMELFDLEIVNLNNE